MLITALIIGFAGSLHCLAMCSPLAIAVTNLQKPYFLNRLLYNGGRILTYALLGSLVSAFGTLFSLTGFQNVLTVLLGSVLIIAGLAGVRYLRIPIIGPLTWKMIAAVKNLFGALLKQKTPLSIAFMGGLNGLLPCGLTYLALTYCLTLDQPLFGFSFMLVFGLGTLPVMLGLLSGVQTFINRVHLDLRRFASTAMIVLGLLLVTRGAYVHIHEEATRDEVVICK